jgi:hypothetical protein
MERWKKNRRIYCGRNRYTKKTICGNKSGFAANFPGFSLAGTLKTDTGGFMVFTPPSPVNSNAW